MPVLFEQVIRKGAVEHELPTTEENKSPEESKSPKHSSSKKIKSILNPPKVKRHYFFLLHGYMSNSTDMEVVAGKISEKLPEAYIH